MSHNPNTAITTNTIFQPKCGSLYQCGKSKDLFFCFMSMILGQFMQMESLEVEDDQRAANGGIKQMVHQVHAKSCRVSTIFMSFCCSYDSWEMSLFSVALEMWSLVLALAHGLLNSFEGLNPSVDWSQCCPWMLVRSWNTGQSTADFCQWATSSHKEFFSVWWESVCE